MLSARGLSHWQITLDPTTNQVQVSGPIADKILSMGVLEIAQRIVMDYVAPEQPSIVKVPANLKLPEIKG